MIAVHAASMRFSALQRAEIAEINEPVWSPGPLIVRFSALQRAEIAEIPVRNNVFNWIVRVSVLFNEPKLLKSEALSTLIQRAEVSVLFNEPKLLKYPNTVAIFPFSLKFQCSSTSRNC